MTALRNSGVALLAAGLMLVAVPAAGEAPEPCGSAANGTQEELSPADRRRALSQGYAQLYDAVSGIRLLDELLLLKLESDETQRVLTDLAEYSTKLRGELESWSRALPWLSLEDDGLPLIEQKTREAQERDRIRALAPVVGASGDDFERTLLLTYSGTLNHLRFLAQALAEAEDNIRRCRHVRGVQRQLDRRYVAMVQLLDRRFFRRPADTPLGAAGKGLE